MGIDAESQPASHIRERHVTPEYEPARVTLGDQLRNDAERTVEQNTSARNIALYGSRVTHMLRENGVALRVDQPVQQSNFAIPPSAIARSAN